MICYWPFRSEHHMPQQVLLGHPGCSVFHHQREGYLPVQLVVLWDLRETYHLFLQKEAEEADFQVVQHQNYMAEHLGSWASDHTLALLTNQKHLENYRVTILVARNPHHLLTWC